MSPHAKSRKIKVVISSTGADQATGTRLHDDLEDNGFDVKYYRKDIAFGDSWAREIDKWLLEYDFVIGLISDAAQNSDNTYKEWHWTIQYGAKHNTKFIPVLLDRNLTLHHQLAGLNYIELSPDYGIGLSQLIDRLRATENRKRITSEHGAVVHPQDRHAVYLESLHKRVCASLKSLLVSTDDEPLDLITEDDPDQVELLNGNLVDVGLDPHFADARFSDALEAFDNYGGRLLLLGDPGSGKTTSLLALTLDLIQRRYDDRTSKVPILANVQSFKGGSLVKWLSRYRNVPADTEQLIQEGKAVLLLDALDELMSLTKSAAADDPYYIHRSLIDAIGELPEGNQVVVTCRIEDYEKIQKKLALNGAVKLCELTDDQIRTLMGADNALYQAIKLEGDLLKVLRNPLLAALFAFASRELSPAERSHLQNTSLKGTGLRDQLIHQYIRARFKFEERKLSAHRAHDKMQLDDLIDGLGFLAMWNVSLASSRVAENTFRQSAMKRIHQYFNDKPRADQVRYNAIKLGLFTRGFDDTTYRFIHMTFLDSLSFTFSQKHLKNESLYSERDVNPILALGRSDDLRAVPLIRSGLRTLKHLDKVRHSAAVAFGNLGDPGTVPDLIALLADENDKVQQEAALALAKLRSGESVAPLLAALKGATPVVTRNIIHALEKINSHEPEVIENLMRLVQDGAPSVQQAAVRALGAMRVFEAADPLASRLSPRDVAYREIVRTMANIAKDKPAIIMTLREQLSTQTTPALIGDLAFTLGRLADRSSAPILIDKIRELKTDSDREPLAEALADIGDAEVLPALQEILISFVRRNDTYKVFSDAMKSLGARPEDIPAFKSMDLDDDDEASTGLNELFDEDDSQEFGDAS